jgi:hypothetical protein
MFGIDAGGWIQSEDAGLMARDLDADRGAGARWVRIDINWAQIQVEGPSSYRWGAIDAVVRAAQARGMSVMGVIVFTPGWARPAGTDASHAPSPRGYAAFARVAVRHYAALGVHAFEVWNEPNLRAAWKPAPNPAAYAALLRAAYGAIKDADRSATVITGGLAPAVTNGTSYSPVDFLRNVYADGGQGYFDAVGQHPYCWDANTFPGDPQPWSAWYQMYGTSPSLRSLMIARGDGAKKIWGTEFGAPTNGPAASSHVDESTQAAMLTKAYQLWSTYRWAGPLFAYEGRDEGISTSTRENFFGLLHHNFTPKPSYAAYRQAAATI